MGMTIDKAIDIMEHYKEYGFVSQTNGRNKVIDIMRKYQQIEEIVGNYGFDNSWICLKKIREVLDNNDN